MYTSLKTKLLPSIFKAHSVEQLFLTLPALYTVELQDSIYHRLRHNLAALVPTHTHTHTHKDE